MLRRFVHIRFHLIIALSILFGCVAWQPAYALSLQAGDGLDAPSSLGGTLAILYDPTGALTIDEVSSGRADLQFKPIPSMLTEGYRAGAVWVRFSLSGPAAPAQWLLQVERPLIENVALYVRDEMGHVTSLPPGVVSGDQAGPRAYTALFPIVVPATENQYFLRLQSMTSITTALNIWQKEGYERYRRSDHWIIGLVLGSIGAMILANLLFSYLLRDSLYLLYAAVLVASSLIAIFHLGYADEILRFLEPAQIQRSWGVIVCLYSLVMVWFLGRLFEFRRHSIWARRAIVTMAWLNGGAALFALAGRYNDVALFVSRLQQFSYIFIAIFVLYLLLLRRQYQYLLSALAFSVIVFVSLVMQSQYTGANPLGVDSSLARFMAVGTLIHLVLISAAVAQRARRAELGLRAEKDRAIATARSAEQALTLKVSERTAELAESNAALTEEMDRRQRLEEKLRQSLDSVNDALAQQRDFVALVSHEFRAPLAVIGAAADNLSLSDGEDAEEVRRRATRIRQTVKRMSMLIDNVLAGERLDAGRAALQAEPLDLGEMLRTVEAGLDSEVARRVTFTHADEARVLGDRSLLEVVVLNLIQNATKYSAAPAPVMVRLSVDQGMAQLTVTDEGDGIAPEDHERIFLKYYRAAGQRANGSGLGLYVSRAIARQHGGDLVLAASDAGGSVFRLSLPATGGTETGQPA
ncbi:MAG: sensor histidine kinase [Devosia sp.]|nr:sensor histidine kinase [Devosia sp.]